MSVSKNTNTIATRIGIDCDPTHGAVVPPLYLSSNFSFAGFEQKREYDYTRSGNPTRDLLAEAIAELEGGAGGLITSSGMSAIFLVLQLLKPDELILVPHDCYGGTYRLLEALQRKAAFKVEFINFNDKTQLANALNKEPKLVWLETPSNPLLRLSDIKKVTEATRAHSKNALVVVDNTFLSPVLQKPIELGADIVVHSTTKYINGHSDVVGGAVVAKDQAVHEELAWWANCLGLSGAPFDAFLTLRGLRSIHARLAYHEKNAQTIAEYLNQHPLVEKAIYPGLTQHPDHLLAKRQQKGFGAMISFTLKGCKQDVAKFLEPLRCFSLAESLGGVESLIAHPASMTHAAMSKEAQETAGITENLLRLSIGIEDVRDLLSDLESGFSAVESVKNTPVFFGLKPTGTAG